MELHLTNLLKRLLRIYLITDNSSALILRNYGVLQVAYDKNFCARLKDGTIVKGVTLDELVRNISTHLENTQAQSKIQDTVR